ncbi:CDP-glycerol glycerophosphotransferase family protein [Psychrobacter cibarius]|uniref:CDP-glycerol glycerophosphotransferase family protein n=3 Tax=Psychrobacter cibarius TaxID=282669 RepID=UPI0018DF6CE9|nr:CDP-glycerol glycerophosphotransferase family protein [Psychrobacter cibarius]
MKDQSIRESIVESLPIDEERKRVLNRRLDKLKRDPKDFLRSSYSKRSAQLISKTPIKYKGSNNFTVVSAVYNVGKYLDDYFDSLVNQSLSFKRHIQLILVDDGSTDNSAEIIKKWQKQYPKNITYLYKENGGIASARNLGLNSVKTEWVTFIDSDDFVKNDYFKIIDDAITKDNSIEMAVGNLMFYFDENKTVKNTHSLKYRFKNEKNIVSVLNMDDNINLFVTVTFFKTEHIVKEKIYFSEDIKPNFEDGKFIADYLLSLNSGNVAYLKDAVFYYRKRSDGNSTIDTSWQKKEKFYNILAFGYIPMLEGYKSKYGYVPKNIQWTILYELSWHIKTILNQSGKINFLEESQKQNYFQLVKSIFNYIDIDYIVDFNLIGVWFLYKVGMLGAFKNTKPDFQITYIENVDKEKKQILIVSFNYLDTLRSYRLNDTDQLPKHSKVVKHTFANQLFVYEQRDWIEFESMEDNLDVYMDNKPARISLFGKQNSHGLKIQEVVKAYTPSDKYKSDDSWILMDRDTQADDNAEHLYRYIMQNYPEQKCYFALSKDSADWNRLKAEGFNLIDFGSNDFEFHLCKASKIISSYFDSYISNYFGDEYEHSKKFIFLQHGVIHTDISKWLDYKRNMLCFVTSTLAEFHAIAADNSPYQVGYKEVVLTGLPRHDQLLINNQQDSKVILIMPTWRASTMGKVIGSGHTRVVNEYFMDSDYAQHWYRLLHNEALAKLAKERDYKIIFAPHANVEPYINDFNVPSYIDTWRASTATTSIQKLFQKARIMITDYSSVAFEMGLLGKTVIYYQFDQQEFFSGTHTTQKGYFDYENDGFGPIVTEEGALITELEKVLKNNGEPSEPYLTRMRETFAYRDTNNCKRVYEAIIDLDRPDTSQVPVDIIMEYAQKAITHESWDLALERIENALQHSAITPTQVEEITRIKESVLQTGYQDEPVRLANILWHEKRLQEALDALKQIDDTEASDELLRLRVRLAILNNDFMLARDSQKLLLENYNETCTIEDWQFYTQLAHV